MSTRDGRTTFVTERQAAVHALYARHRSMSAVARMLGVAQITVRETLVQYQRNQLRDLGVKPPPLRQMLRGDVTTRFGVSREEVGGRPALHGQVHPTGAGRPARVESGPDGFGEGDDHGDQVRVVTNTSSTTRLIVTAVEPARPLHLGFWRNLCAFAAATGAGLRVIGVDGFGAGRPEAVGRDVAPFLLAGSIDVAGQVEVATGMRVASRTTRPLAGARGSQATTWTVVGHPVVQLETLPRVRADGLRVALTTGTASVPDRGPDGVGRDQVGAVLVELSADSVAHCRHLTAWAEGDGRFQDLDVQVADGRVTRGHPVAAITYGDVHHAFLDPAVAVATWGLGVAPVHGATCLVDRLRPGHQVFHDICDFGARSPFDARNGLKRFAQVRDGSGDVRAELKGAADFLAATRRDWCESVVVASNHDDRLVGWLRDADHRDDPTNAVFFLETSLALHRRLQAGEGCDGFFEQTLRTLSADDLAGVRFLGVGESRRVAGIEIGLHGHQGPDGKPGGMQVIERLGIRATIGHTHRPTTRDGVYGAGVCQTELEYARGPLTAWAVGHVVTYAIGTRQHLLFQAGAFHA